MMANKLEEYRILRCFFGFCFYKKSEKGAICMVVAPSKPLLLRQTIGLIVPCSLSKHFLLPDTFEPLWI
jgi:hypothetical protein